MTHSSTIYVRSSDPGECDQMVQGLLASGLNAQAWSSAVTYRDLCLAFVDDSDTLVADAYRAGASSVQRRPLNLEQVRRDARRVGLAMADRLSQTRLDEFFPGLRRKGVLEFDLDTGPGPQGQEVIRFGLGGFFVPLGEHLPAHGDGVEFMIRQRGDVPIFGAGIVRWASTGPLRPSGVGVEIACLAPSSIDPFEELLVQYQPKMWIPSP